MSLGPWPAILAATVAAWLIGALWYSRLLFAQAWVRAHAFTPEQLAAMRAKAPRAYAVSLVAFLITASVLSIVISHLGADSLHDGAGWGFHVWLGFAFPIGLTGTLFSDRRIMTFMIDGSYQLVYLTVMGAILGGWS